ncbi:hypothetical protein [Sodaliphilus pleomorphus]|uniref:Uncharacterized protein n=1 Tax=Sodaliphilus pleomorphus TaxID=2606626 RepID=A0A6L5XGX8_9BACT|nr:hypothetical protein [Sodaliphilus pleomorphus]MSS18766.1 hypothetical protein [Sodaliphilus pleomorphus]
MILPSMTYSEIKAELKKEYKAMFAYADRLTHQNQYKREGLKHSEPITFKPVAWTSKGLNK